jgi:hypothetical protein
MRDTMVLPDWLLDIFRTSQMRSEITRLTEALANSQALCNQEWEQKNTALGQVVMLQQQYRVISNQMTTTISALDTCRALTKADKDTIFALQTSIDSLNAELKQSTVSLYTKGMPELVKVVAPSQVMLADYQVKTATGLQTCQYPDHPSVFQPSPIFESILTSADCNRRRDDITEVEIATRISNVLQLRMSYVTDATLWGRPDNWTPATLALIMRRDDCESLSHVILSALFYYQLKFGAFKDYSCFYAGGHIVIGGNPYGHGFVMLIHDTSIDLKDSFIIEATDNWASPPMPISSVKDIYDCDWGLIGYVRNGSQFGTYEIKEKWWKPL